MRLDEIARAAMSRVDTIRVVRTAVNPLLWLVGLTTPLLLLGLVLLDDRVIRLVLIGLAATPVFATLVAYFIFMFRDPDRLQSEEYRIKLREMRLRYRKGRRPVVIDQASDRVRIEHDHGDTNENPSAGLR